MQNYLNLLEEIMTRGVYKQNRTGIATKSLIFKNLQWDLSEGFPLITTKKLHTKSIVHELLWFLKGDTNIKYLNDNGVSIWNEWSNANGDLGKIYGYQWRNWEYVVENSTYSVRDGGSDKLQIAAIDQISELINNIKKDPNSRRLLVSAWNVGQLHEMALPRCHYGFQVIISENKLNLQWNQR